MPNFIITYPLKFVTYKICMAQVLFVEKFLIILFAHSWNEKIKFEAKFVEIKNVDRKKFTSWKERAMCFKSLGSFRKCSLLIVNLNTQPACGLIFICNYSVNQSLLGNILQFISLK